MKKESENRWGTADPKSLLENCAGRCGNGYFARPTQSGLNGLTAAWEWGANSHHSQPCCRPKGFRAKGRLASLLLSRRSTRDILLRPVSPASLLPENSALRSFQTGSWAGFPRAVCSSVAALLRLLPEWHHPSGGAPSLLTRGPATLRAARDKPATSQFPHTRRTLRDPWCLQPRSLAAPSAPICELASQFQQIVSPRAGLLAEIVRKVTNATIFHWDDL
jgi:hypothetical protein